MRLSWACEQPLKCYISNNSTPPADYFRGRLFFLYCELKIKMQHVCFHICSHVFLNRMFFILTKCFGPISDIVTKLFFAFAAFYSERGRNIKKKFIYFSINNENALDKQMLMCYNIITIELLYGQKRSPTTGMLIAAEFFVMKFYSK